MKVAAISESFLHPSWRYIILYSSTGDVAKKYIDMIAEKGAKWTLETMLLALPLSDTSNVQKDAPWGLFDSTYALGDYTLWWDESMPMVAIVEKWDSADPYDNY